MGIKSYNPYTPSRRHMTGSDFSEITAAKPEKSSLHLLRRTLDVTIEVRSLQGHQVAEAERKYRIIDFKEERWNPW